MQTNSSAKRQGAPGYVFATSSTPNIAIVTNICRELQPDRLQNYVNGVEKAGGICHLVPVTQSLLTRLPSLMPAVQGIILTGGGDVLPEQYGAFTHTTTYGTNWLRDQIEIEIARRAMSLQIPILGICRGAQILAVAFGGTLHPHLLGGLSDGHRLTTSGLMYPVVHSVNIKSESRLHQLIGSNSFFPVSYHHCAVKDVPYGWESVAQADDGVIEAIECSTHPFALGVQWHPEMGYSPEDQLIFRGFIEAAIQYRFTQMMSA